MRTQSLTMLAVGVLGSAAVSLNAQPVTPADYIGAEACGACHAAQFTGQSSTGHAHALSHASQHTLAKSFAPEVITRVGKYGLQFRWDEKQLRVRATDLDGVIDIPVEWAFGAGAQAVTFVTRIDPDWYLEHSLSYYTGLKALGPTPGQQAAPPASLKLAMGAPYRTSDPKDGILGCFECHSTGPVSESSTSGLHPRELGVRCEACHGPGNRHRNAASRGEPSRLAIGNPKRLSASALNQFCGKCHRPPAGDSRSIQWNEPWNVRHQPLYLDQSACFLKSKGALSCLTCHEPHQRLRNDAAFYNQKCAGCHNGQVRPPKPVCVADTPADCTSCHMPRVSPQAALRFSNHWIGVYASGARLRPKR